jgi:hypothetical protein
MTLTDGRGGPVGHRPGYLLATDTAARSAKARAYRDYDSDLTNAWRDPPSSQWARDAEGSPRAPEQRRRDFATDAKQAAYAAYDVELREAWRSPE